MKSSIREDRNTNKLHRKCSLDRLAPCSALQSRDTSLVRFVPLTTSKHTQGHLHRALHAHIFRLSEFITSNLTIIYHLLLQETALCESVIVKVLIQCNQTYSVELVINQKLGQLHPVLLMSEDKLEHKGGYFLQNFILLSQQLYKVQVIPYIRWKYAAYFDSSITNKQKTLATKKNHHTPPHKKEQQKQKCIYQWRETRNHVPQTAEDGNPILNKNSGARSNSH